MRLNFILLFCFLCATSVVAKDRAVLKKDSDTAYHVDVIIERAVRAGADVVAALYKIDPNGNRVQVNKYVGKPTPTGGETRFSIAITGVPTDKDAFVVAVFEFPSDSDTLSYDLAVSKVLSTGLEGNHSQCDRGVYLQLDSTEYSAADWETVEAYFAPFASDASALGTLQMITSNTDRVTGFHRAKVLTSVPVALSRKRMDVCLRPVAQLPRESYDANIKFNSSPIPELVTITAKGLTAESSPKVPGASDDNGIPGKRGQEVNLDFGISFNSSVAEVEQPDKTKMRERVSRGTFDLRLSPWMYSSKTREFNAAQKWYRYFNPFFVDAAVSTGKIEEDTLSLNRVIFGAEHEWRYYAYKTDQKTGTYIYTPYQTMHRFILTGTHASDRDFKQLEYAANFEYQPIFGRLNHPLYLNWKNETGRRVAGDLGYEIIPRFGGSIGRTYARRDPAEVIKVSPTVRRFFTGLDLTFNLTRYLTLSASDTFWLRGEAADDRFHNYFKGGIEVPLGRPFENSVHSFFMTFERGNQPPFATPDVNVLKMGYRIRSDGWFNRDR